MAIGTPARQSVFNLPNQLTAARFVLGVVLFVLIEHGLWVGCVVVFALAAATDWLDGYLARRRNLVSSLGRQLDPLVDKVVICGAYIFLLPLGSDDTGLTALAVTVIVARELIITGLRSFMENRGAHFGADWLGKIKMGLQCITLFAIFGFLYAREKELLAPDAHDMAALLRVLVYVTVAVTALSGLQYLWRAALLLKEG
jgi:CDP-diacylglycerol--glycerol-3-phosphate 3-phosphatidyltransferase